LRISVATRFQLPSQVPDAKRVVGGCIIEAAGLIFAG